MCATTTAGGRTARSNSSRPIRPPPSLRLEATHERRWPACTDATSSAASSTNTSSPQHDDRVSAPYAAFWNETVAFEVQAPLTDAMVSEKRERFCPPYSWIPGDAFERIQVGHRSGDVPELWREPAGADAFRGTEEVRRGSDALECAEFGVPTRLTREHQRVPARARA